MSEDKGFIVVKRVKKVHKQHHGGSWKVAYADFVTAMMAFFLLLWLVGAVPDNKKYDLAGYLKSYSPFNPAGESYTKIPDPMAENVAIDRKKEAAKREAATVLSDQIRHRLGMLWKDVVVDSKEGEVRVHLVDKDGSNMFEQGEAEPTVKAKEILKSLAVVLKKTEYRIAVEGHSDAAGTKEEEKNNWKLSTLRALAAKDALVGYGLDGKFRYDRVAGYGSTKPLHAADPADPRNRRVSLLFLTHDTSRGGKAAKELNVSKRQAGPPKTK